MPLQGPIEVFALTRDGIFSSVRPTHGVRWLLATVSEWEKTDLFRTVTLLSKMYL